MGVTRLTDPERAAKMAEPESIHDRVERLFREARSDVYYYILSFSLTAAEAQEIAQDVFLRFYVAVKRGEAIESPRGWLFRAAHNLALNEIERRTTRRLFELNSDNSETYGAENPEQRLIRKQSAGRIQEALSTLSPRERLCLHLRAEGFRYADIAETTGVGISTVAEFLSRAIRKLRKAVHE
jgi:RNA polymerase sigma-70 factor (ECF subfamily)